MKAFLSAADHDARAWFVLVSLTMATVSRVQVTFPDKSTLKKTKKEKRKEEKTKQEKPKRKKKRPLDLDVASYLLLRNLRNSAGLLLPTDTIGHL